MPDNRQIQNNAVSTSTNASPDNIQEAMWRLQIQDNQEGVDAQANPYPDRPGEPDCIYYLRTGFCGYGSKCRYNHPTYIGQGIQYDGELPERIGQPDCQYFLKTGTCKFGATCKYHHPRDRHDVRQVPLNIVGLPMRQDEKSCPYYMRTGSCKFGIACKFHHPQPTTVGAVLPITGPSAYGSTGSSVAPPTGLPLIGGLSAWSLPRPPYMSSPRMQGIPAYMPIVLPPSQGIMSAQQGWSTYTGTLSHVSSTDVLGVNEISKHHVQSSSSVSMLLPDRPDQPECLYYMKTGACKYGPSCKYHHPKERNTPEAMFTLGPLGLPLRPGQAVCSYYSMYGNCKYGSACKFDHPLAGYCSYALPAISISDPSALFPYQRNSQFISTSSEASPSKKLNSHDRLVISETNNERQNSDNNVPDELPPQTTSPSQTAPSSGSPQDHSE